MYDKGKILIHIFENQSSLSTLSNSTLLVLLYHSAMSFGISGVALVTGAGKSLLLRGFCSSNERLDFLQDCCLGSGIGRDAAIAFAAEGAIAVAFADINLAAAQQSADQSVEHATNPAYYPLAIEVDVTDLESVERMVAQVVDTFKRIDYSVNSAGVRRLFILQIHCLT